MGAPTTPFVANPNTVSPPQSVVANWRALLLASLSSHQKPPVPAHQPQPRRIHEAALAALGEQLAPYNRHNRQFHEQWDALRQLFTSAVTGILATLGNEVEQVVLDSDELLRGVDLRHLSYTGVALDIWMRSNAIDYDLYDTVAHTVFEDLDDSYILLQFDLIPRFVWTRRVHQDALFAERARSPRVALLTQQ